MCPASAVHQGENNRDQVIIRGNSSSADFFVDGVRDDVQYYRDLYNLSRVEVLKGPNALIFGRGGAGGVVNRVGKEALFQPHTRCRCRAGCTATSDSRPISISRSNDKVALRLNGMFEDSDSFRTGVGLQALRHHADVDVCAEQPDQDRRELRVPERHARGRSRHHRRSRAGRSTWIPSTFYGNPADSHVAAAVNVGYVTIRASGRRADDPQPHLARQLRSLLSEFRAWRGVGESEPGGADRVQQRHRPHEPVQSDGLHLRGDDRRGPPHAAGRRRSRAVSSRTTSGIPDSSTTRRRRSPSRSRRRRSRRR